MPGIEPGALDGPAEPQTGPRTARRMRSWTLLAAISAGSVIGALARYGISAAFRVLLARSAGQRWASMSPGAP